MNLRNIWATDQQYDFNQIFVEFKKSIILWLLLCLAMLFTASPALAQNQSLDTSNGNACVAAGGALTGNNLFTAAGNGSFGTGSGDPNDFAPSNPFPEITGGVYRNDYSPFPHGSFTIVSNQVDRRNTAQFNGTQVDPVNGASGRFLVSDPDVTSPVINTELTGVIFGEAYEMSFWVADTEPNQNGDKQRMAVIVDNDIANPAFLTPFINSNGGNNANNPVVWQLWSFVYTHNSAATSVALGVRANETGSSGRDIFLDEISVRQCLIPTDLVTVKSLNSADNNPQVDDIVTYSIVVTNNGSSVATNVSLTDLVPNGLIPTANNGNTADGTYNNVSGLWTIGTLATGSSATLTIEGRVAAGQGGNIIINTTTVAAADQPDPTTVDDVLTISVTVGNEIVANNDDFSGTPILSTGGTTTTVFTDDTINGNSFANGDVITTIIDDDGLTGVTINNNGIITVPSGTTPGTYNIEYQICEDGNPTNCDTAVATIVVMALADLSITKTNTPGVNGEVDQANDIVIAGSTTNYTLIVTNNGPDSVTGAVVTDTPTAGVTCPTTNAVTISGNGVPAGSFTFNDLANGGITLGTLADGQSATLTYSCTVN